MLDIIISRKGMISASVITRMKLKTVVGHGGSNIYDFYLCVYNKIGFCCWNNYNISEVVYPCKHDHHYLNIMSKQFYCQCYFIPVFVNMSLLTKMSYIHEYFFVIHI